MSLHSQCLEAANRLMEEPPEGTGGVFTEIDVVRAATNEGWSDAMFGKALKQTNQLLGNLYRARKLVRYGPITFGDEVDYGRVATKIAYASAENGPQYWRTPNGAFPRLLIDDDQWSRQGRRRVTERNDLEQWAPDQFNGKAPVDGLRPLQPLTTARQLSQARADLKAAYRQLDEARQETQRLREHRAEVDIPDDLREIVGHIVVELVGDLDGRVRRLEEREERRREVYVGE